MPRFTILRGMIAIGAVAGVLASYRAFGASVLVELAASLASLLLTGVAWMVARRRPRLAAWAFATSAVLASASIALVCAYLYSIGGIILMFLGSILLIPPALACGSAWALAGRSTRRLPGSVAWSIVLASGLLPISMMVTGWPPRLAFALSRPSMDRLADRVAAGGAVTSPEWAGLYRVVAALRAPSGGNIALIIDADPSGRSGFVRHATPPAGFGPMVNLNYDVPVGGPWNYQNED